MEKYKTYLTGILSELLNNGNAAVDNYSGLREVDSKIREVKLVLSQISEIPPSLIEKMDNDPDFSMASRRVRLEALANYCKTALKFIETGIVSENRIYPVPDISKLTVTMPNLENSIKKRWIEAQKCQNTGSYLAAIILMGSILEGLLLSRVYLSPADAGRATSSPKDRKSGKALPFQDWSLNSLIDVATELGWLKSDRGKFTHALRESRNVVHPWAEIISKSDFDEQTCKTSWEVLKASISDLINTAP